MRSVRCLGFGMSAFGFVYGMSWEWKEEQKLLSKQTNMWVSIAQGCSLGWLPCGGKYTIPASPTMQEKETET